MTSPTADQIACAIVTAARACDNDPIEVAMGRHNRRARHFVYEALKQSFPQALKQRLAGYVSGGDAAKALRFINVHDYYVIGGEQPWFKKDVLAAVVRSIREGEVVTDCPLVPTPHEGRKRAVPKLSALMAARDAEGVDVTAVLMGDPSPERSAMNRQAYPEGAL